MSWKTMWPILTALEVAAGRACCNSWSASLSFKSYFWSMSWDQGSPVQAIKGPSHVKLLSLLRTASSEAEVSQVLLGFTRGWMATPRPDCGSSASKTPGDRHLQKEDFSWYFGDPFSENLSGCSLHLLPAFGAPTPFGKHRSKFILVWIIISDRCSCLVCVVIFDCLQCPLGSLLIVYVLFRIWK